MGVCTTSWWDLFAGISPPSSGSSWSSVSCTRLRSDLHKSLDLVEGSPGLASEPAYGRMTNKTHIYSGTSEPPIKETLNKDTIEKNLVPMHPLFACSTVWEYGRMRVWEYGSMRVCEYGSMRVWECVSLRVCEYGRMRVWQYGTCGSDLHGRELGVGSSASGQFQSSDSKTPNVGLLVVSYRLIRELIRTWMWDSAPGP